jgi:divinyl chlorophyllide a 8-vinyl-reductase
MAKDILLLGATGTIGRATLTELQAQGHRVTCLTRRPASLPAPSIQADVTNPADLTRAIHSQPFDAIVSCLASRTGTARDAWAIDHVAHLTALRAAQTAQIPQFTLLSAICVQRPLLPFQHAKLAFEAELATSGLTYAIVRPTAYFKSLSGQLNRLRAGKPFLLFGDGRLTACKPISDADLGCYLAQTLTDPALQNRILPIGGPGPALTPRQTGEELFRLLGLQPRFKQVPVALLTTIIATLATLGRISPRLRDKADLARIGRYYATESMLVWNPATGQYDADATPETGRDTLFAFYAKLVRGDVTVDRGDHAVF